MHMLKLLFQELQVRPTTPLRDSRPAGAQLETSKPLYSRERQKTAYPWEQLTTQGENTLGFFFLNLIFHESQNPSLHFVFCYKKAGLEGNVRWSIRV